MLHDHLQGASLGGDIDVVELEADTDDGAVYGVYDILAHNGATPIKLRVEASAVFAGEKDCWSWSSESHYTKPVEFDELEDFEMQVVIPKDPAA
jgi:hypothetical protein